MVSVKYMFIVLAADDDGKHISTIYSAILVFKISGEFQRSSMHIYIRSYYSLANMVGFRRRRNVRIVQCARQVL